MSALGQWQLVDRYEDGEPAPVPWWEINGRECTIYLEQRPVYCDRGNWYAKIDPHPRSMLALALDMADGWPRYYFNLDRAKLELEAWLRKRGQL